MTTLVLYVFHEYNDIVKHFIKKAIFQDDKVEFLLIYNNENKIEIDKPDYVKLIYRNNEGYDFGGWSYGLLTNNLYKKYEKFIFVNSSVIGPFLKPDYEGKWTDIFINGLTDDIKIFGSSINTCHDCSLVTGVFNPASHVQSYLFCMNKDTVEFLIKKGIFSTTRYISDKMHVILLKEVNMSHVVLKEGWNIGCLLNCYKGYDFKDITNKTIYGNIITNDYYNKLWNEYETVFIKTNRDYDYKSFLNRS